MLAIDHGDEYRASHSVVVLQFAIVPVDGIATGRRLGSKVL